jgi:hypothetical protein
MKKLWLFIFFAAIFLYFPIKKGIDSAGNQHELSNKKETFSGSSTSLQKTAILPTLDTPIVIGKNNIWCSSFQLAWNELKETVIQGPIEIEGAEKLSQRLSASKQSKTDLSGDSYYSNAGKISDGIAQKIKDDMAGQFPSVQIPEFSPSDELVAYAYLETYLKFTKPFRQYETPLNFTGTDPNIKTPVKSFGVWGGYQRKYKPLCEQIDVLYCKLDESHNVIEYTLDLCKNTEPYQIIISTIESQITLEETITKVQAEIRDFEKSPDYNNLRKFDTTDILQVPEMFWKINHHFIELEDKIIANQNFQGLPISTAMQMISFRLDRSGVILKSESMIAAAAIPRMFVLDRPFLLYLKKRNVEYPFFVMWIDNAELLTPFNAE